MTAGDRTGKEEIWRKVHNLGVRMTILERRSPREGPMGISTEFVQFQANDDWVLPPPPTFYPTTSAYLTEARFGGGPLRARHQREGAQRAGEAGGAQGAGGAVGAVGARGAKSSLGKQKRREVRTGAGVWPGVWLGSVGGEGRGWFRASGPPGLLKGLGLGCRLAVRQARGKLGKKR